MPATGATFRVLARITDRLYHDLPRAGVLCLALALTFDAAAGSWRFAAPQQRLFRPLLADPTEARLAVTTNLNNRLNGYIGASWEAADYTWEEGRIRDQDRPLRFRTGIHAGVFSKLRWSGTTFPLETVDYLVGFHVDLGNGGMTGNDGLTGSDGLTNRNGGLTGRFEYAHVSAHLGDGYDGPERAFTYSREYFTLYGSYVREARRGTLIGSVRVYGSLRWSNHAIPDVRRWRVQAGAELVSGPLAAAGGATRAYLAGDLRVFRDGDVAINRTVQAGLLFHNEANRGLRIALVYHGGRSEHGQFHHLEDNYGGVGLFFDL